jgi:hypothetical protein
MAASSLLDACRFTPTAGSTTDWTFSAAVTGYQSLAAAGAMNGAQYSYRAESADLSQWEIGSGTYNSSTGILSRSTVLSNSSGTTSKINFTTVPQVAVVALNEDLATLANANSFAQAQSAPTFKASGAPTSAWGLDCSAVTLTVTGSGSATVADGSGLLILTDGTSTGHTGAYLVGGSLTSACALLGGGSAYVAPTTTPASNKYSVAFDGTHYRVYNGNASAITFTIAMVRTRTTV